MAEQANGVTPETAAPATPPVAPTAEVPTASEGVTPQEQSADYKALYEQAKQEAANKAKALREAREKEEAERQARLALEQQLNAQPDQTVQDDEAVKVFWENKAKTDLLTLQVTDPFVKDNFNLVLAELQKNPMQGADAAATRVKASIMDNIVKTAEVVKPVTPTTPTPGAVPETVVEQLAGDEEQVINQMEARLKGIR